MGLGSFIELFVSAVNAQSVRNFRLLRMDRGGHRSEPGRVHSRMLFEVLTEGVMILIAHGHDCRLGRLKTHVVPAEILEIAANLLEPLRAHGRTGGALAGEEAGREGGDRLGFAHCAGSLLAGDTAAEAADWTRTCRSDARRRSGRCEYGPAEILFETIRNIFPELGDFLGRASSRIDLHHRTAVDH